MVRYTLASTCFCRLYINNPGRSEVIWVLGWAVSSGGQSDLGWVVSPGGQSDLVCGQRLWLLRWRRQTQQQTAPFILPPAHPVRLLHMAVLS